MTKGKKAKTTKRDEIKELKEQLARALADYDNLTKRVEKERDNFRKLATLGIIARVLPIYDMLEEAQEQLEDSGLAIIIKEFLDVFGDEGIEKIDAKAGMVFNEELHEAVEVVDEKSAKKGKDGKVVDCLLSGWKYKDGPVIRPAKVKVAKKN